MKKSISELRVGIVAVAMVAMSVLAPAAGQAATPSEEGIALAIVYDTSGSMKESVANATGGSSPKFIIAQRALAAIVDRLQAFAQQTTASSSRKIQAGLVVFGNGKGEIAVPFGPFNPEALRAWMRRYPGPNGNTPLGDALRLAVHNVLRSNLTRKHVLVVTDGMNTAGPDPAAVWRGLKTEAARNHSDFTVHFVAFDVAAKVFEPLKKLGATVVSAADETQLNTQLEFILEKKILLEEEEAPAGGGVKK